MSSPPTLALARFVEHSSAANLPAPVVHEAKRAILNWVGCAVGASRHATVSRSLAALKPFMGPPQATVLGRRERVDILHAALRRDFAVNRPRILVAGLNPHAGEGGHLGREEIEIIEPVLNTLRVQGMDLIGPLPADTLFQPKLLQQADAILAMYHDQGLPVLKHASFGQGVNITLGLPILRTSVDHGTALDLAGQGQIGDGSLRAALAKAREMASNRAAAQP